MFLFLRQDWIFYFNLNGKGIIYSNRVPNRPSFEVVGLGTSNPQQYLPNHGFPSRYPEKQIKYEFNFWNKIIFF